MREDDLRKALKEINIPDEMDERIKVAIKHGAAERNKKNYSNRKPMMIIAATFLLGVLIFKGYEGIISYIANNEINNDKKILAQKKLPIIDNKEKFIEIAKSEMLDMCVTKEESSTANTASAKMDYSSTNNQVQGVDELDIIKTDGKYIFSIDNSRENHYVHITDVTNPNEPKKISNLDVKEPPRGLFLYKNNLIVVKYGPYGMYGNESKIDIYDYSNLKDIKLKKEIAVNGIIEESRLIGDELILVSFDYIYHEGNGDPIFNSPYTREDGVKNEKSLKDIKYCPGFKVDTFMSVLNVNLRDLKIAKSETILVNRGNIYVSKDNMYLTSYDYKEDTSLIYKLSISGGVEFKSEGKVKGKTLNQFSMDEYNGNLRIALTEEIKPNNDKKESSKKKVDGNENSIPTTMSSVVVLDNNLKEIGRLEGLGKGEIIHSARFMGDKAYVVTFKRTDPLYIIDMSNPKELKLVGELKIPGVSKYLHPIDDKTLIGFGEDRDDVKYGGLKVSIFSVEGEPKELHNLIIKNKRSPAIYDHKGFFYSSNHDLMTFEVSSDYYSNRDERRTAEVYKVDRVNGFSKVLSVPLEPKGYEARTLYINDCLYILDEDGFKVFNINTFEKISEINF